MGVGAPPPPSSSSSSSSSLPLSLTRTLRARVCARERVCVRMYVAQFVYRLACLPAYLPASHSIFLFGHLRILFSLSLFSSRCCTGSR
jgi:hypothetical protein